MTVRRGVGGDLLVDLAGDDEIDQRLREGLHVEEGAFLDRVGDRLGLVLADEIGDSGVGHHHLDRGDATAVGPRQEALADHAAQDAGHDRADHLLLPLGEELDHPADRLGGVDGVKRREHEVSRLRGLQGGLRSLGVAKLADQDHVRVLAKRTPERLCEVARVETDLALVDDARVVAVQDLDRVLDRDDVLLPRPVDVVDDRCERRRLSRPRCARDEHEPAMLLGKPADAVRKVEHLEVGDVLRNDAECDGDVAALPEGVDPEPRQIARPGRRRPDRLTS